MNYLKILENNRQMLLNLKECKVYIISPGTGKYLSRLHTVFQRIVSAGFTQIEFFKSIPSEKTCDSLALTVVEIFKKELHTTKPFFILEDDCELWFNYDTMELPDSFSLFYAGIAKWAYPHPISTLFLQNRPHIFPHSLQTIQSYNNQLVQVKAMTGGHAILYNCRNFMREFIKLYDKPTGIPHDLIFSSMIFSFPQLYFAFAFKQPMFFQDKTLGGQEEVTRLTFDGVSFS